MNGVSLGKSPRSFLGKNVENSKKSMNNVVLTLKTCVQ